MATLRFSHMGKTSWYRSYGPVLAVESAAERFSCFLDATLSELLEMLKMSAEHVKTLCLVTWKLRQFLMKKQGFCNYVALNNHTVHLLKIVSV
jgi:hypothetical protein